MHRTSKEQNIEQVAGIIAEHIRDGYGWTIEDSKRTNADGWTIEVRYDYQGYTDRRSFTRVEGLVLSAADLEAAHALAERLANA